MLKNHNDVLTKDRTDTLLLEGRNDSLCSTGRAQEHLELCFLTRYPYKLNENQVSYLHILQSLTHLILLVAWRPRPRREQFHDTAGRLC